MKKKSKPVMNKPLINKNGTVRLLRKDDSPRLKLLRDVFPELAAHSEKRKAGRPRIANPKRIQSFKLSADLIADIKASGAGYNVRVEDALRHAIARGMI
jgi:uncharacterized protein (DUF4415 family)